MRKSLVLATLLVLCCSAASLAGVPDPARSGCELKGLVVPCQYRFRCDGGLDCMTLCVTLRDAFDAPVDSCSTSAAIVTSDAICSPCGLTKGGTTDAAGVILFEWCRIGGRGSAEIRVTAHCVGEIEICTNAFDYTSPDLDASCDPCPGPPFTANILDLGLWSGCLPPGPYCQASDYNCDGTVNILDLGVFAGGLTVCCDAADCALELP